MRKIAASAFPAMAFGRLCRMLLRVAALLACIPVAMAQQSTGAAPRPYIGALTISQGSGEIITLKQPVSSLFAADPGVIEVHPASPTSLFVFGKGVGETSVVATDAQGNEIAQYQVSVTPSHYSADRVAARSQIAAPGAAITAESEPGGMIVRGTVATPEQANNVINQAKIISPSGTVINQLQVQEPIQVELKVRIAYMSRDVTRQLGINWSSITDTGFRIGSFLIAGATGTESPSISGTQAGSVGFAFPGSSPSATGGAPTEGTFEGMIDALATDNLAHIVAEPTLTTLSGTQASFLVGGQFPIPVAENNDTITIEFKSYGVQLVFTPTVFSDGRIALQVAPTLSQLSNANSVTETAIGSSAAITVPSLIVQQASSTVILGSGQGMALAGLLEDQSNETNNAVPGLGEVPVLGALFRGDSFQRSQQELVITVTPYVVNPVSNPGVIAQPDDGWTPPNDLQRILMLRDSGSVAANTVMPADSGFMVQ